jgi:hypothetical protein
MKKGLFTVFIGLMAVVALSASVQAQETKISGFVDTSYFNDENSDTSTFGMDQVELDVEHKANDKASLRFDLEFTATGGFSIEQGFIAVNAGPATVTVGKFNAPIGFELLDAPDMYQFSHAMVFDFGLPTNLTGVMVSGGAGMIDYAVYIVNGWDNNQDENTDKDFGGRLGITPTEGVNIGLSYISGKTGADPAQVDRSVLDVDFTYTRQENLTIGAEYNSGEIDSAKWSGFLVMGHYDFSDTWGLTLRYDSFNDEDSVAFSSPTGETRNAITIAPTFSIAEGLGGIIEWKSTTSDEKTFTEKDGVTLTDSEMTFAVELTYSF